jgi:hypothetical protein
MFAMATHMFSNFFWCFASGRMLQVFHLFRIYVASVLSGCCKSRSVVAYGAMGPTYRTRLLQLLGRHRGSLCGRLRPADASIVLHPQVGAGD